MVAMDSDTHPLPVLFQISLPQAEAVYLMGAFNNWSTTRTPMQSLGDGWWEVRLLPTEAHGALYAFVWSRGRRCGQFMPLNAALPSRTAAPTQDTPVQDTPVQDPSLIRDGLPPSLSQAQM